MSTVQEVHIRLVTELHPRLVMIENVAGIANGRSPESLDPFLEAFDRLGYKVAIHLLDACEFGIPQRRRRDLHHRTGQILLVAAVGA